jgi:hypothetical protein
LIQGITPTRAGDFNEEIRLAVRLQLRPIARTVALEMGFRLPLPAGTVIRKADLGVVPNANPQPVLPLDVSYHGVFDLCIEALSTTGRGAIERDTVTKKAEYAAGGVPEYYILHREPERQAFLTRTADGGYVPIAPQDGVIRSRVLSGLQFHVTDLCAQPAPSAMVRDPVYAEFVLPEWPETEARAVAAEAAARQDAEQQADTEAQARRQAEHALAELRAQRGAER